MNGQYRMTTRVEMNSRQRWIVSREDGRLRPTQSASVIDFRGSFARNGQMLAGSGALVFEGEVLEGLRLN